MIGTTSVERRGAAPEQVKPLGSTTGPDPPAPMVQVAAFVVVVVLVVSVLVVPVVVVVVVLPDDDEALVTPELVVPSLGLPQPKAPSALTTAIHVQRPAPMSDVYRRGRAQSSLAVDAVDPERVAVRRPIERLPRGTACGGKGAGALFEA